MCLQKLPEMLQSVSEWFSAIRKNERLQVDN